MNHGPAKNYPTTDCGLARLDRSVLPMKPSKEWNPPITPARVYGIDTLSDVQVFDFIACFGDGPMPLDDSVADRKFGNVRVYEHFLWCEFSELMTKECRAEYNARLAPISDAYDSAMERLEGSLGYRWGYGERADIYDTPAGKRISRRYDRAICLVFLRAYREYLKPCK